MQINVHQVKTQQHISQKFNVTLINVNIKCTVLTIIRYRGTRASIVLET